MARQVITELVADASKFKAGTSDALGEAGKLDQGLRNTAIGGAVAGVAMGLTTKAIDFVGEALVNASAAAKIDTASQDRLALAYKNTGKAQDVSVDAIEAAITANQKKGVSDDQQRAGISDFLDKTKNATDALKLNNATVELAAAKGIAYADAEAMILSASAGKTAALKKAGVEIEKGASITEIATAVNKQFGGSLDEVAATQGGKTAIANEKMGEAMEKVGKIINDVSTVVLPVLLEAFAGMVDFIATNVAPVIERISAVVIPGLVTAFKVIGPVVGAVFGVVGSVIGVAVGIVSAYFGTLGNVIGVLASVFRGIATVVSTVFGAIGVPIRTAINGVIGIVNGIIGAINRIAVHIHVGPVNLDWNGLNLGRIPTFHTGGIVPGARGAEVLTILQAGERVTPLGGGGPGGGMVLNVNIENFTGSDSDIDRLADRLALRLRLAGVR